MFDDDDDWMFAGEFGVTWYLLKTTWSGLPSFNGNDQMLTVPMYLVWNDI